MTFDAGCARVYAMKWDDIVPRWWNADPEGRAAALDYIRPGGMIVNEHQIQDRQCAREFMPDTRNPQDKPGFLQNLTDFTGPFGIPLIQEMRKQDWKTNEEQAPKETVSHGLLVDRSHSVFALLHRLSFFGLPHDAFFGPIRFNPEGANVTVFGPVFEPDVVIENIARGKVIDPQWQLMSVTTDFYQQTASVTLREKDEVSLRPKRVTITYRVAGVAHRP